MLYRTMGLLHAKALQALREERGQGTVEYVGLMLVLGGILAGVVAAAGGLKDNTIATAISREVKEAIDAVGKKGG